MGLFLISGFLVKSLINKNCHNFRTSNVIDMKLGPVTKLEKGNTMTLKNFEGDVVSANYDVIVLFPISLIATFYFTKSDNRTKNL